ncbi:MAG: hypothetical protein ETSY2_11395 [Candidatus Entotheonella gemina]|uniref:Glycosyltransferase subfamily 4-like N-terminal domain-containing protein n=1 Tax=Candidatus Entotheonella gemina TaxID=1429439 RepID=W4MB65_9BACT|nr:MAG: hypothetical protein ETSY2_11395 [Candidatus Entotheonella gemina]
MLRGKQIICLSSIDWDFNWQGHQEIMTRFAAAGNAVLFVENTGIRMPRWPDLPRLRQRMQDWHKGPGGIRQVQDNLHVCAPLICPFPYSRMMQRLNRWLFLGHIRRWVRRTEFGPPLLWTFLPTRFTLEVIDALKPASVVYYCIADFLELGPPRRVQRSESALLRRANVVFAQGEVLADRCRRAHTGEIPIVPFGVNIERFQRGLYDPMPAELQRIPGLRIGYVGALQRHVDKALLKGLAARNPDWHIVIVGPQFADGPHHWQAANIHLLGAKSHEEIPRYIAGFDVCLIPYVLSHYTQTVYPTKLTEYLSLGKPVVSTPLPEVLAFNQRHEAVVAIGDTPEAFEAQIRQALCEDGDRRQQRMAIARQYDWATRLQAMSRVIEDRIEKAGSA